MRNSEGTCAREERSTDGSGRLRRGRDVDIPRGWKFGRDGRSVETGETLRYPRLQRSGAGPVARHVAELLREREDAVLVYGGRVVVDRRFLKLEKNRKHANMLASILHHDKGSLGNAAYIFTGNSTGECSRDLDNAPGPSPCLIIAKVAGAQQRGVLVPNPYHQDLDYWRALRSHIRARAASRPWSERVARVFWRGSLADRWHAPDLPGYLPRGHFAAASAPRLGRGYSVKTSRGDTVAGTWLSRGDE